MKLSLSLAIVLVFLLLSSSSGCRSVPPPPPDIKEKTDFYAGDSFYKDPVLQYLGWSQEDIIELYGEPDIRGLIGGPGGEFLYYGEKNISFIFAGEDEIVNNLKLFPGGEVLGVQVGMSFNEIEEILGPPRDRGYDEHDGCYSMVYWLGEEKNDLGEIEIYFHAVSDNANAPTESVMVLWKKYWDWW